MNFESFYIWAIGNGYHDDLTIERIDNNKGYSPDNCKWATQKEQNNNKRTNIIINFDGQSKNITQWANELSIKRQTLAWRINKGWPTKKALKRRKCE